MEMIMTTMTVAEMKAAAIAAAEVNTIHGSCKLAGGNHSFEVYVVRVDRWSKVHFRCTYYVHGKRTSAKTFEVAFEAYKRACECLLDKQSA
jgi:hypothetical protein